MVVVVHCLDESLPGPLHCRCNPPFLHVVTITSLSAHVFTDSPKLAYLPAGIRGLRLAAARDACWRRCGGRSRSATLLAHVNPGEKVKAMSTGSNGDRSRNGAPQNILVAFDGSAHALSALEKAVGLAQAGGARLTLVTVVHRAPVVAGPYLASPLPDVEGLVGDAEKELARAQASVPEGISAKTVVRVGITADEILECVKEGEHDLVVAGTRGHGDLASLALGSVSHELIRRSPVPVLVVRDVTIAERESANAG
jgi:nucleotide-binding universal stress UspA family protein